MDGQAGPVDTPAPARSELNDDGFIMVALLVGIAIASVWMAALLPSWRQQVVRERETELIFRGQQYARAIRLYQQQMGGALPTSLDDLVAQHMLRRKWKDPITGDEFLPKACLSGIGGGSVPGGNRGAGGVNGGNRAGAGAIPQSSPLQQDIQPLQQPPQRGAQAGIQTPTGRGQSAGGFGQAAPGGGICGVQSKSNATSIKIYNGQQEYDLWQFDLTTAAMQYQQTILKFALTGGTGQSGGFRGNGFGGSPGATPRRGASPGGRNPFDNQFPGSGLRPGSGGSPPENPPNAPRAPVGRGGRQS